MDRKPRPLLDLVLGAVVPSLVLMYLSDGALGASGALVVALAFPVALGLHDLVRFGARNHVALLGLVSVLMTGGIGLLQLDARWLAIKEAAIPALLGIAVLISAWVGYPLMRVLLYNVSILNIERIGPILRAKGLDAAFEERLRKATYVLGATFFFSAAMNFLLATWLVTSRAGSAAFNEELGQLTLISYPVIAIPSLLMMLTIVYALWRSVHALTGLPLDEVLAPSVTGGKQVADAKATGTGDRDSGVAPREQ